jgi:hypothetical protein
VTVTCDDVGAQYFIVPVQRDDCLYGSGYTVFTLLSREEREEKKINKKKRRERGWWWEKGG